MCYISNTHTLFLHNLLFFSRLRQSGHIEVLRWLRRTADCPWSEEAVEAAAREGRLDVVRVCMRVRVCVLCKPNGK